MSNGYPGYTTSPGWLGYSEEKIRKLSKEAILDGWKFIKMKVGKDVNQDMHRAKIIREEIGYDNKLMMDANQKWEVGEAIENMRKLAMYKPHWIEEPTSPDDILGHAAGKVRIIDPHDGDIDRQRRILENCIDASPQRHDHF